MSTVATTRMSSKGQVVIPEEVRNSLGLETGAHFIVMGENDVVILKTISPPSMSEFDTIVTRARRQDNAPRQPLRRLRPGRSQDQLTRTRPDRTPPVTLLSATHPR